MRRDCWGCDKKHDGSFAHNFCSNSCWLNYLWRRAWRFGRNGSGRY